MRKGFVLDHNRCVDCGACKAACILENGWNFQPRTIYKFNSEINSVFPKINLSLACNHCEKPACLYGCPSRAYTKDTDTGAVIINNSRCIACNYCKWNCPYDAPKSDPGSGLIGKCNLCLPSLKAGYLPACASSCPTGALDYQTMNDVSEAIWPSWFPDKKLDPAIELKAGNRSAHLKIIPAQIFDPEYSDHVQEGRNRSGVWSLIAFSFLSTLSVALMVSSLLSDRIPDLMLFIPLILAAGLVSFFHLGKKKSAWRAVFNIRSSPLSREIVLYLIFLIGSFWALLSESAGLVLAASVSGLLLLLFIDTVYTFSDNRLKIVFNSGQTFITGLLMASFFSGLKLPFLFIAVIKVISGIYNIIRKQGESYQFGLRFLHIAILATIGTCLITGISFNDPLIIFIFLTGELIDRILFYIEFEPVNINSVNYRLKVKS